MAFAMEQPDMEVLLFFVIQDAVSIQLKENLQQQMQLLWEQRLKWMGFLKIE